MCIGTQQGAGMTVREVTLRLPHSSVLLTVALTLQPGAHKARIRVLGRRLFTAIDTAVRPRN